jgi:hypothetical protein
VTAYFDDLHSRFEAAARGSVGVVERHYRIGGRPVRLRLGGPAMVEPFTRALSHLAADPVGDPSLSVCVADATIVAAPPSPWAALVPGPVAAPGPRADSPAADAKPTVHARDEAVEALFQLDYAAVSLYDKRARTGMYWTASADLVPPYERGAPLRTIFHWWGLQQNWHVVHAGAVGTDDGGVLLVGKAGSGKSTVALACLAAGLAYLGDNDALLAAGAPPFVHGLYCAGKLDAEHVRRRLPHLLPLVGPREARYRNKDVFFVEARGGATLAGGFPLRAVLIPRITGAAAATARRVPASAAVVALAPSTLLQLPGAHRERLRHLVGVLRDVPAYVLEMGDDVASVPAAITRVLEASA